MAKSVPALINPEMLVWARESARLSIEDAAHRIGIAAEKLTDCEAGKAQLTFAQLIKVAREYRRPVSLFYLKEKPVGWASIQDFRHITGIEGDFPRGSRLLFVRRASAARSRSICAPS
jgi:transcriptional regulator with XRE-family HTH domain